MIHLGIKFNSWQGVKNVKLYSGRQPGIKGLNLWRLRVIRKQTIFPPSVELVAGWGGGATSLKGLVQKLIYLISLLNVLFESLHGLWSNDNCTGLCGNWPTLSCWCTPLTGWCRGSERWLWSPETRFLYHSCDSYSISWGWGDEDRSGAGQIRGSSCHIMLCTPSFSQTVVHLAFYRQLDVHCMGGEGREICADKICQSFRSTAFIIIFICLVKKKKNCIENLVTTTPSLVWEHYQGNELTLDSSGNSHLVISLFSLQSHFIYCRLILGFKEWNWHAWADTFCPPFFNVQEEKDLSNCTL